MADGKKVVNQVEDQELSDLLDSALKDFNKEQKLDKVENEKIESVESTKDKDTIEALDGGWTTDFIEEAADHFEENLQNLIKNERDCELGPDFKKLVAQTFASVLSDEDNTDKDSASTDFETAIARALNDLSATSENLQNEPDLSEMLGQASLDDELGAILPLMQGMLDHLLSKGMLYASLKELVDKYMEWLEEKNATIPANDLHRYTKQLELMRKVCVELEKEKAEDNDEIKRKRCDTIISLLQEVQGCGQLPEELIDGEGDHVPKLLRGLELQQNCRFM
ncbi:PREDICTED: peroxisomal biogenesis factor 19 [Dufourea novaeangliae]|uniref:Peroxin-19 n=1 Tax=Dufourea novaeangliae TaxID=178035 RepID=A0A154P9Z4_DUFNO|nr:PREDICTED: peroxisomal biogenesis factor 19 [Dufourea novaeangliae]KZC08672.1 Peroxisomal biogenesis factor 19 [Dufourea novaeangliae]